MSDAPDLKPCPFCAGPARLTDEAGVPVVICRDCGAQGSTGMSAERAVEEWNRRAGEDDCFYLFAWERHDALGGANDLQGRYETIEAAEEAYAVARGSQKWTAGQITDPRLKAVRLLDDEAWAAERLAARGGQE